MPPPMCGPKRPLPSARRRRDGKRIRRKRPPPVWIRRSPPWPRGCGARATRVRRLALEALIPAEATDAGLLAAAAHDPDAQVRRIAMRAAPAPVLAAALDDDSPIVRLEAVRQLSAKKADEACAAAVK